MSDLPIISTEQAANTAQTEMSLAEWIFGRIRPYVGGRVLEIDDGEGLMAPFCRIRNIQTDVLPIDLMSTDFDTVYSNLLGEFDMAVVLHTSWLTTNTPPIIANCAKLLKKDKYLIIQLPAFSALYDGLDDGYRKWKRQNIQCMSNLFYRHFEIVKIKYSVVSNQEPYLSPYSTKYRNKVPLFNSTATTGFNQKGLHALVVAQKCQDPKNEILIKQ